MRITFLGTGTSQGVPVIACKCGTCLSDDKRDKRLRSSVLIETGEKNFVIDTGPDFRQQMLREKVTHLEAILFTHDHRDHIAGLDDIRAFNFNSNSPVDVYAEENVQESLKKQYSYVFENNKYPGTPRINIHLIQNTSFFIDETKIIPIRVMHYRLPVLGFRIGDFTYITDANFISEQEKEKIIGTKHLVINALRRQKHISHYNLSQSLKIIKELSPRKAYLIHMSHQMGRTSEVEHLLPDNVMLAYDGLKVEV